MKLIHAARSLVLILCVAGALSGSAARADVLWYNGDYAQPRLPDEPVRSRDQHPGREFGRYLRDDPGVRQLRRADRPDLDDHRPLLRQPDGLSRGVDDGHLADPQRRQRRQRGDAGGRRRHRGDPGRLAPRGRRLLRGPSRVPGHGRGIVVEADRRDVLAGGGARRRRQGLESFYGAQSFVETTSGAGSVGVPPGTDGQSFVTSNFPTSGLGSYFFPPSTTALDGEGDGPQIDFSMGVIGSAAVPEPAGLALAGRRPARRSGRSAGRKRRRTASAR